jgi:hypothetical protein
VRSELKMIWARRKRKQLSPRSLDLDGAGVTGNGKPALGWRSPGPSGDFDPAEDDVMIGG